MKGVPMRTSTQWTWSLLACSLPLFFAGCSSCVDTPSNPDGGGEPAVIVDDDDGGTIDDLDGGSATDGGGDVDAGDPPADSGTPPLTDAGAMPDSGVVTDAGLVDDAPTVRILSPADGSYARPGDTLAFLCEATDDVDGVLDGTAVQWASDQGDAIGVGASVSNALATLGAHTISCSATDSAGQTSTASIRLFVVDNLPPVCTITSPADGDDVYEGATTTFAATCTDPEDGAVDNASIRWTSSQDGNLGVGASVQTVLLAQGAHVVEVCAPDPSNVEVSGCASVDVNVVPLPPPTVAIVQPAGDDTVDACVVIALSCEGTDALGATTYSWSSSIDGVIGATASLAWTPASPGTHTLTCTQSGPGGDVQASVDVTIQSPTITINRPDVDTFTPEGDATLLRAVACSTLTGQAPPGAIAWSSDVDGALGSGNLAPVLSAGQHVLSATVTLQNQPQATAAVVHLVDAAPMLTIEQPVNGSEVVEGATVNFVAQASDAEDGALTPTWVDALDGDLGQGVPSHTGLMVGVHDVTATVTDSVRQVASDTVRYTVTPTNGVLWQDVPATPGARSVFVDEMGGVWIGRLSGLVGAGTADAFFTGMVNNFPSGSVDAVTMLDDGTLLVGSDQELALCDPVTLTCEQRNWDSLMDMGDMEVTALVTLPDGRTVLGTPTCLVLSDWTTNTHRRFCEGDGNGDELRSDVITDLALNPVTGEVLVATDRGVSIMEPADGPGVGGGGDTDFTDFTDDDGLSSNEVFAVVWVNATDWAAGTNDGVDWVVGNVVHHFTPDDGLGGRVNDLAAHTFVHNAVGHEVVWAGTEGGLTRIELGQPLLNLTTNDGLVDNRVRAVTVDGNGDKWLATPLGASVYAGR
mgnify:CR=1 FL=1